MQALLAAMPAGGLHGGVVLGSRFGDSRPDAFAPAPMGGSGGKKRNPVKAVVAGGIAGACEACISYPTEFVKTQLQLFEEKAKLGPVGAARETIRTNGGWGLGVARRFSAVWVGRARPDAAALVATEAPAE